MTGFIRGLFGGKPQNPGETTKPVRVKRNEESFYLDPDDAKTYGDIDYMRTVKTVRRTFAKKRGELEEKESIKQVSAMDSMRLREDGTPEQKPAPTETTFQPSVKKEAPSFDRRKTDTNLDMFRQMAKDMKK